MVHTGTVIKTGLAPNLAVPMVGTAGRHSGTASIVGVSARADSPAGPPSAAALERAPGIRRPRPALPHHWTWSRLTIPAPPRASARPRVPLPARADRAPHREAGKPHVTDPKHHPSDWHYVPKTSQCMWCGQSEGAVTLQVRRRVVGREPKMECTDRAMCESRIHVRILIGSAR